MKFLCGMCTESRNATSDNCVPDPEPKSSGDNGKEPEPQPLTTVTNVKMVGTGLEENGKKRGDLPRPHFVRNLFGCKKENEKVEKKKKKFRFLDLRGKG